ncbi:MULTISPECIES: hypothetical protein [unclassified Streptomyces]
MCDLVLFSIQLSRPSPVAWTASTPTEASLDSLTIESATEPTTTP